MPGPSLVAASGGHSPSRCADPSLPWPLLLQSTGSRRAGSVIVAHGPSRSAARGLLPDQGSNPCPPHWQAESQPLRLQGSPSILYFNSVTLYHIAIIVFLKLFQTMCFSINHKVSTFFILLFFPASQAFPFLFKKCSFIFFFNKSQLQ